MTRATPTARAGLLLPVALVAAYYGAYIAVLSPPMISMALRVRDVLPPAQA
ncbi:hypothetical protein [Streptomyces sp. SPB162]|uniref:hypothetical protein n=1 Tax=Streptomyces sp. SPB162 TaxID=2940560 RepID=UPI002406731B|nr:hypothetical protein [Streptomyces sp. SPB162]MDF9811699.1 hypothetical protein [Streptomyces sp. SPB162]